MPRLSMLAAAVAGPIFASGELVLLAPAVGQQPVLATTRGDLVRSQLGAVSNAVDQTKSSRHTQSGPDDGSAQPSAGRPQWPDILSKYAFRPEWAVAGVDYRVGLRSGAVLKAPGTISMPGVVVDPKTHWIEVTRGNLVIEGYDFSSDGGWHIEVSNEASSVTIQGNYFKVGSNNLVPVDALHGGYVTLRFNTFDGGGRDATVTNMINTGSGATIEKNRFTSIPNDAIDITRDGHYTIRYNLFDLMNWNEEFHTDCIQTYFSAVSSLDVEYNTLYQPEANADGWPGGMNSFLRIGDEHGNVVHNPLVAYNTVVMLGFSGHRAGPGATANVFDISAGDGFKGSAVLNPVVHHNFIDPNGVMYAVFSPYVGQLTNPTIYNNVNMRGKPSPRLLAGMYNSWVRGVPTNPPRVPVIVSGIVDTSGRLILAGFAPEESTITVTSETNLLGSTKADGRGAWSFTTSGLGASRRALTVTATDSLGNTSAASPPFAVGRSRP